MSDTAQTGVGQAFRGLAGLATLATLLATVIITILGIVGVVEMDWVVADRTISFAYVAGIGASQDDSAEKLERFLGSVAGAFFGLGINAYNINPIIP